MDRLNPQPNGKFLVLLEQWPLTVFPKAFYITHHRILYDQCTLNAIKSIRFDEIQDSLNP